MGPITKNPDCWKCNLRLYFHSTFYLNVFVSVFICGVILMYLFHMRQWNYLHNLDKLRFYSIFDQVDFTKVGDCNPDIVLVEIWQLNTWFRGLILQFWTTLRSERAAFPTIYYAHGVQWKNIKKFCDTLPLIY